jgi:hypothetical protein
VPSTWNAPLRSLAQVQVADILIDLLMFILVAHAALFYSLALSIALSLYLCSLYSSSFFVTLHQQSVPLSICGRLQSPPVFFPR